MQHRFRIYESTSRQEIDEAVSELGALGVQVQEVHYDPGEDYVTVTALDARDASEFAQFLITAAQTFRNGILSSDQPA